MFRRLRCATLALGLSCGAVHADTLPRTIGATELNLSIPQGFCLVNRDNFRDGLFFAVLEHFLQGTAKVVMATVECGQLDRWRGGDNDAIKDYSMYYIPLAFENLTLPGQKQPLRKGLCDEMRKQGAPAMDKAKTLIEEKAKSLSANLKVAKAEFIGVVADDDVACYSSVLIATADTAKPKLISGVVASTVLRAKPIFLALYSFYKGPETTQASIEKLKPVVAELESANP